MTEDLEEFFRPAPGEARTTVPPAPPETLVERALFGVLLVASIPLILIWVVSAFVVGPADGD